MTAYFSTADEPLDGDNWQALGTPESDGYQFEQERPREVILEITPEIRTDLSASLSFNPTPETMALLFGYDVYALRATVAEWLNRPAPMPGIPMAELIEMQDGINRLAIYADRAHKRYALPQIIRSGPSE